MGKMRRRLVWFAWNGTVVALAVAGVLYGVTPAANVVRFIVWPLVLLNGITFVGTAFVEREKMAALNDRYAVSASLNCAVDVGVGLLCASAGFFVTAFMWVSLGAMGAAIRFVVREAATEGGAA